jgi:quercetin dioxygenase-like cupin family protein
MIEKRKKENIDMAYIGELLENPVTGEHVVITETALSTHGTSCTAEVTIDPHGFVTGEHIHPRQEETFEVTKGRMRFSIAGKEADAHVGQVVVIPAGVPHSWWNASDEEIATRVTFRPALNSETFFETFFGLARDGKTDAQGRPNLLQSAILFSAFKNEIQFLVPLPVRVLLKLLFPFAWVLGYRAVYPRYSSPSQQSERKHPANV